MGNRRKVLSSEEEFIRLFWAARKEHNNLKSAATPGSPAHAEAINFANAQSWQWAIDLLEASRLARAESPDSALALLNDLASAIPEGWRGFYSFLLGSSHHAKEEYDEAFSAYRKAIDDPKFEPKGRAWYNLGNALAETGRTDEAISAYLKAIDDHKYESTGNVWNNLGIELAETGRTDEAISAYFKAIDDHKYESPGNAWYNLGNALAKTGRTDEAISAYLKAIDDPKNETPGSAWFNLGNVCAEAGRTDEAISAYLKAIDSPKYESPGNAWYNLGIVYAEAGRTDEAISAYLKAIDDPKFEAPGKAWTTLGMAYAESGRTEEAKTAFAEALKEHDPSGWAHSQARFRLSLLEANIEPGALSVDDRALLDIPVSAGTSEQIEDKIIARIREAGETQYDRYLNDRKVSGRDDTLSILRGWSSAVTLLEGSERLWRGGGYFLKWHGHGVVIDPGFDFLRNFHDAGFHGREIGAVLVSHNHPDHNSDLKDIDDLRYEMWKRLKGTVELGSQPYVLIWDLDSQNATKFGSESPQHQLPPIVMSSGFPLSFDLRTHVSKIPLKVIPFKVDHGSDVKHAMGMVIELLGDQGETVVRIGYTADTEYFTNLHEHLKDCDVLIAHISQPTTEELQDESKQKSLHLGYRGTARLIAECQPTLTLVGEFWAGLTDLRIPLVKGLKERSGVKHILPSGLGMHLKLPTLDVECTECGKPTSFAKIKVAPPADSFGSLAYLCENCILN